MLKIYIQLICVDSLMEEIYITHLMEINEKQATAGKNISNK